MFLFIPPFLGDSSILRHSSLCHIWFPNQLFTSFKLCFIIPFIPSIFAFSPMSAASLVPPTAFMASSVISLHQNQAHPPLPERNRCFQVLHSFPEYSCCVCKWRLGEQALVPLILTFISFSLLFAHEQVALFSHALVAPVCFWGAWWFYLFSFANGRHPKQRVTHTDLTNVS